MEETLNKTQERKIITLISDWGEKDYYAGAVKGRILSMVPEATVVDISHQVNPFDITHAGYILQNVYKDFPEGTVHIIGVDAEEFAVDDKIRSHLVVKIAGYYFIGADNGIFSLLADPDEVEEIIELTIPFQEVNKKFKYIFSVRDRLVYAAAHIARGGKLEELGNKIDSFQKVLSVQPSYTNNFIKGVVIHVDNYENVIVNVKEDLFNAIRKDRDFTINFRNHKLNYISDQYSDVAEQRMVALFNSSGYLEIAINKANASGLLGLRVNDTVIIEFYD